MLILYSKFNSQTLTIFTFYKHIFTYRFIFNNNYPIFLVYFKDLHLNFRCEYRKLFSCTEGVILGIHMVNRSKYGFFHKFYV